MAISDNAGIPIAVHVASAASPHEVTLAEATISKKCFVSNNEKPEHLVGDKAYDSDPLDERLAVKYGVEMISPHRGWRETEDAGRSPPAPLQTSVEDREAIFCMVAEFPTHTSTP